MFGAGDGDRTGDVQLGNFLLKIAFLFLQQQLILFFVLAKSFFWLQQFQLVSPVLLLSWARFGHADWQRCDFGRIVLYSCPA